MRVLLLCTTCPTPPFGGAAIRSAGWLNTIADGAEVALVTLVRNDREHQALLEFGDRCALLHAVPAPRTVARKVRDVVTATLSATPYFIRSAWERRMWAVVETVVENWRPDVVQAELLPSEPYLESARRHGIPTVYSAHNVESRIRRGALTAAATRRIEARAARRAAATVAVSTIEAEWFRRFAPRVVEIPNAVELAGVPFIPPSKRCGRSLLFLGRLDYGPNIDAAVTLAGRVFPEAKRRIADLRCVIAGARPARSILGLAGNGVEVLPNPTDTAPLWIRAAALVCPLDRGGGSRIKILEAAARGVPVVSTPLGAEGLALEPSVAYLAEDDPRDMAAAAAALVNNPERADTVAAKARQAVERNHCWTAARPVIMGLYEGLADHRRPE